MPSAQKYFAARTNPAFQQIFNDNNDYHQQSADINRQHQNQGGFVNGGQYPAHLGSQQFHGGN